jgi:outer membrane biosynthesis protein TonB
VKPKVVERVVEKRVEVPVSVEVPVPMGGPTATVSAEPSGSAPKVAQKGGTAGPTGKPAAAPTASGGSNSLKGLDMGPAGPSLGGPDPGGPAVPGGAGALSGGAVEGVVSSKRVGVRKQCYEGSGGSDKGDATVKIQIKIAPDGSVTSSDIVQSDGPAAGLVGPCIQRMSKTWRFPASDSGGTFAIPFIFKT